MQAKKSLGQNFLINDAIIKDIVSLFEFNEDDLIIEIGPGMGALTQYLVKEKSNLVCIEIDKDMDKYLSKYESNHCKIIYDDILKIDLKKIISNYKYNKLYIIGNLPYYITSPIIEHITESNVNPYKMAFMVQKEVAIRYSAKAGNSNYGYMSVYLDCFYNVQKVIDVGKNNFNPVPKVDSAVICLESKNNQNYEKEFFVFLKKCFAQKRKTLKNNLKEYDLEKINLTSNIRAEQLSLDQFIDLYKALKK